MLDQEKVVVVVVETGICSLHSFLSIGADGIVRLLVSLRSVWLSFLLSWLSFHLEHGRSGFFSSCTLSSEKNYAATKHETFGFHVDDLLIKAKTNEAKLGDFVLSEELVVVAVSELWLLNLNDERIRFVRAIGLVQEDEGSYRVQLERWVVVCLSKISSNTVSWFGIQHVGDEADDTRRACC
ncbi:hypothetical protein Tco_0924249 [Tanacetum coccineum]|uniref:Uncharacterized protein n=1 Tax=Tanacetum coccineum TaxID=301880 RepID=A0ABQ5D3A8_9ASTR